MLAIYIGVLDQSEGSPRRALEGIYTQEGIIMHFERTGLHCLWLTCFVFTAVLTVSSGAVAQVSVAGVQSNTGHVLGGYEVAISGSGFDFGSGTPQVFFGGVAATNVEQTTVGYQELAIQCTVPAGTAGSVDVRVVNPGSDEDTLTDGFTYVAAPAVSSVQHPEGAVAGGNQVVIFASGLTPIGTTTVDFGGQVATDIAVKEDGSRLTCTTPPHAAGLVTVTVTNDDASSGTGSYTFVAMSVTSIDPENSSVGGASVVIRGTGFQGFQENTTLEVTFGGTAATNVKVAIPTYLSCTAPPHAVGAVDVVLSNQVPEMVTLPNAFTYLVSQPVITSITPDTGDVAGGIEATIQGTAFDFSSGTPQVLFGETPATDVASVYVGYGQSGIGCTVPAHVPGTVDVTVINPDTGSDTLADAFTYTGEVDTTPPLIWLNGSNPMLVDEGGVFTDPGASALDNTEGDISHLVETTGTVDMNTPGTYVLTYSVSDAFDNAPAPISRSVYVDPVGATVADIPGTVPPAGLEVGRPGIGVAVEAGDFDAAAQLTFERADGEFSLPGDGVDLLPTTAFGIDGLSGLADGQSLTITLDYPDGNQDGIVDGTHIVETALLVFALAPSGESITIAPDIDPVANTATFEADETVVVLGGKLGLDGVFFALGVVAPGMPLSSPLGIVILTAILALGGAMTFRQRKA